jgi:hypothetical protein
MLFLVKSRVIGSVSEDLIDLIEMEFLDPRYPEVRYILGKVKLENYDQNVR